MECPGLSGVVPDNSGQRLQGFRTLCLQGPYPLRSRKIPWRIHATHPASLSRNTIHHSGAVGGLILAQNYIILKTNCTHMANICIDGAHFLFIFNDLGAICH